VFEVEVAGVPQYQIDDRDSLRERELPHALVNVWEDDVKLMLLEIFV
jgi:hypothetical protein